jgi:hypothetical protein
VATTEVDGSRTEYKRRGADGRGVGGRAQRVRGMCSGYRTPADLWGNGIRRKADRRPVMQGRRVRG